MSDGVLENHLVTILSIMVLTFAMIWVYTHAQKERIENIRSRALQKSLEKYKKFFSTAVEGIFQCGLDGTFKLINDAGARILGYKDAATLLEKGEKSIHFYVDCCDREQNVAEIHAVGKVVSRVAALRLDNGRKIDVAITAHLLKEEDGTVIGYEGIFRDITDRVELEKKLLHYSETLEERVKTKTRKVLSLERSRIKLENLASLGEMAAMIIHEIKNPLASIKMAVTTILKRTRLEAGDQKCLELAENEVARLERFIKAVLEFAKPMKIQFVKQDVNVILDYVIQQYEGTPDFARIEIIREFDSEITRTTLAANQFHHIMQNLLLNAMQSLDGKKGRIIVRSRAETTADAFCISVEDNGKGIKKEHLEQIFEPFFSQSEGGTGLGLTVVKRIVEAHGGSIRVKSGQNKGTTVSMRFPVYGMEEEYGE